MNEKRYGRYAYVVAFSRQIDAVRANEPIPKLPRAAPT